MLGFILPWPIQMSRSALLLLVSLKFIWKHNISKRIWGSKIGWGLGPIISLHGLVELSSDWLMQGGKQK